MSLVRPQPLVGFWLLASGFWLLASGLWLLASGFGLLVSGFWLLVSCLGFWCLFCVLASGLWPLASGFWLSCFLTFWLLASGFWLRTSGFWLLACITPCGTRARNLRIRSPTPCPLGQGGTVDYRRSLFSLTSVSRLPTGPSQTKTSVFCVFVFPVSKCRRLFHNADVL